MRKAIIDIDGVLNDYPSTFIRYYNNTYHTQFKTLHEMKNTINVSTYAKAKNAYRQSDYKHKATISAYAKTLVDYLHAHGFLVYIITARKLFMSNQLEQTILWLKTNGIMYDYIYCSAKKDFTIIEKFGHVDVVIEDNVDNINNIFAINGPAHYYNVINADNADYTPNADIHCLRVNSLKQIIDDLSTHNALTAKDMTTI